MSRIDIEGAIPPLSEGHFSSEQRQNLVNERQKQQFARYLPLSSSSMQDMAHAMANSGHENLMQTDYRIVSGPLSGTRIHVSLAAQGLVIVLSHRNRGLAERLQRLQSRWQRQLHQLGFPCLLEVTHDGDIVG
ncbi:hypothetical protein [Yersinia kristensenii]|uniref:Uncharacterized protein n=1 Tax=Yersinia kristensenii TaxID=28152 RepID=A0A0T9LSU7_YERKR|nr:hypothetical protein [Yersinia kristensenii]MDR4897116.1 hypothetical protein [Yersinia kristensenii]MDX6737996.1 hypothetical protein [Yersinia kristensenii]OVZ80455.1 hypothetical protein CBW52_11710 [Yersinia kristensenii]CFR26270.1 Uncharacterised protein [Yersinia kristensenii]CNF20928.1 Uncharacterised protein [Yersinia kristensenii]